MPVRNLFGPLGEKLEAEGPEAESSGRDGVGTEVTEFEFQAFLERGAQLLKSGSVKEKQLWQREARERGLAV